MCDHGDLGLHVDPQSSIADSRPTIVLYDSIPAGIGFSQRLFQIHADLMIHTLEIVMTCKCSDGCPSCVGPGGEEGSGGKQEALAILMKLTQDKE
jgi:DEAD/DEAH box helicase domain-containing protein